MMFELLIIGNTPASWSAALTAARMGRSVGLCLAEETIGDHLPDLRYVPESWLEEALSVTCPEVVASREGRKRWFAAEWTRRRDELLAACQIERDLREAQFLQDGGTIFSGPVSLRKTADGHFTLGEEGSPCAPQLVLATGTHTGSHDPGARLAADLLSLPFLPLRACVIGASQTGLRAAAVIAAYGGEVMVIDGAPLPEEGFPEDTLTWIEHCLNHGVQFLWGEDVLATLRKTSTQWLVTSISGKQHLFSTAIWAVERQGKSQGIGLEQIGLSTDDRGRLWCTPSGETWVSNVWAAGDIVGFPQHSVEEAVGARNLVRELFSPNCKPVCTEIMVPR